MLIFFVVFLALNLYFAIDDAKKNNAFGLVHAAVAVYCGMQTYHLLAK